MNNRWTVFYFVLGLEARSYFKLLCKFVSTVCGEKSRCVFEHAEPRM